MQHFLATVLLRLPLYIQSNVAQVLRLHIKYLALSVIIDT